MKFLCTAFLSLAVTSIIVGGADAREPRNHHGNKQTSMVEEVSAGAASKQRNLDGTSSETQFPLIASIHSENSGMCNQMKEMDVLNVDGNKTFVLIRNKTELNNQSQLLTVEERLTESLHKIPPLLDCYRTVAASYDTMDTLVNEYPSLAEIINIGPSYLKTIGSGGYDMQVLKLTNKDSSVEKSHLFVICSIHAREKTPAESCARFAEKLLSLYGSDADMTWILDYTEIHVFMQANPDGRADDEANNHYRRKNMNFSSNSPCSADSGGVDLNRNFPHSEWGKVGVTSNKCGETYPGQSEGSEPETKNIVKYMTSVIPKNLQFSNGAYSIDSTGVLIDIHSYGQDFFWPWAWTRSLAPNETGMRAMAHKMASYTSPTYSTNNPSCCSGDTTDWAYEAIGVSAFTMELGTSFYQNCESFETTVMPNVLRSLLYAARVSKAPYLYTIGPEVMQLSLDQDTNDNLVVTVEASDSQRAGGYKTGKQDISEIALYLDTHPYEGGVPDYVINSGFNSPTETGVFNVDVSILSPGKHIIYARAKDSNVGPVYALFHTILSSVPSTRPSSMPSSGPSALPSVMPSVVPSSKPSDGPSISPSSMPSSVPSTRPSSTDKPSDSTVVRFVSSKVSDVPYCLDSNDNLELEIKLCVPGLKQQWRIDERGYFANDGNMCLMSERNGQLNILECPKEEDDYSKKYVFVYNAFHNTIIAAAGNTNKFLALQVETNNKVTTKEYLMKGETNLKFKWTLEFV